MNFQCSAAERMLFAELVMRGASPPSVGLVVEGFNRHHWPMGHGGATRGNERGGVASELRVGVTGAEDVAAAAVAGPRGRRKSRARDG